MMFKIINKGIISTLIFFLVIGSSTISAGEQFTIAVLPCSDIMLTFKKFNPLVTYLKQQTGIDMRIVIPNDYVKFESAVKNKEIDFAFLDPHTYVRSSSLYNKSALIRSLNREGMPSQQGVVIVKKGSGIKTLNDLRGKVVMFGSELSATKWIAARLLFKENGINIDKDLSSYSNGGCCEDIAFNVYLNAVDAGVVCNHFLAEHSEKQKELGINADQFIIIGKTKSVPTRLFVARKDLRNDIVTKVNKALLKLDRANPEHAKILYPAELGGFQRTRDDEYKSLRNLMGK
jgi:phosphate/phosphite/phosphonate ABC transporter binding protein